MNIHSAELLENSLQNAADNLYRNRALAVSMQEEAQRNAIEQSFRNAMMQHYANIEERQEENAGLQEQRLENADNIAAQRQASVLQQQQQQSGIAQKQNFLRTAMQLNATGQLAPEGLKRVNQWLSTDPDLSKTGIQLSAPANPSTDLARAQTALAQAIALRQQYQQMADGATDPRQRDQYSKIVDDIDASLGGKKPSVSQNRLTGQSASASSSEIATPLVMPVTPPASHIAYLQTNPWRASQFDEKYGPGASAKYLKQQQPIPGGGGLPISVTNTPPDLSSNGQ